MGIANHETLHALYDLGLFRERVGDPTKPRKSRKFVKVNKDGSTDVRVARFMIPQKPWHGENETKQQ